jgi:UDP-2-acetamido-3-amino-2,3-dideoxy-glucuronate N-acetyltransferase
MAPVGFWGQHCCIAEDAQIGADSRIGNFVLIRENTVIGRGCTVGSYVDIEGDVRIGNWVSLQSGCYLTRGVVVEDEVFLGPRVVTMNDRRICHRRPSLTFVRAPVRIGRAARIGGGAVLCPGIVIGENAFVASGSVVTKDVPDMAMVQGNPAVFVRTVSPEEII